MVHQIIYQIGLGVAVVVLACFGEGQAGSVFDKLTPMVRVLDKFTISLPCTGGEYKATLMQVKQRTGSDMHKLFFAIHKPDRTVANSKDESLAPLPKASVVVKQVNDKEIAVAAPSNGEEEAYAKKNTNLDNPACKDCFGTEPTALSDGDRAKFATAVVNAVNAVLK